MPRNLSAASRPQSRSPLACDSLVDAVAALSATCWSCQAIQWSVEMSPGRAGGTLLGSGRGFISRARSARAVRGQALVQPRLRLLVVGGRVLQGAGHVLDVPLDLVDPVREV